MSSARIRTALGAKDVGTPIGGVDVQEVIVIGVCRQHQFASVLNVIVYSAAAPGLSGSATTFTETIMVESYREQSKPSRMVLPMRMIVLVHESRCHLGYS